MIFWRKTRCNYINVVHYARGRCNFIINVFSKKRRFCRILFESYTKLSVLRRMMTTHVGYSSYDMLMLYLPLLKKYFDFY